MLNRDEIEELRSIRASCENILSRIQQLLPEAQTKKRTRKQEFEEEQTQYWTKYRERILKQCNK
jgi:hypothetical protein